MGRVLIVVTRIERVWAVVFWPGRKALWFLSGIAGVDSRAHYTLTIGFPVSLFKLVVWLWLAVYLTNPANFATILTGGVVLLATLSILSFTYAQTIPAGTRLREWVEFGGQRLFISTVTVIVAVPLNYAAQALQKPVASLHVTALSVGFQYFALTFTTPLLLGAIVAALVGVEVLFRAWFYAVRSADGDAPESLDELRKPPSAFRD